MTCNDDTETVRSFIPFSDGSRIILTPTDQNNGDLYIELQDLSGKCAKLSLRDQRNLTAALQLAHRPQPRTAPARTTVRLFTEGTPITVTSTPERRFETAPAAAPRERFPEYRGHIQTPADEPVSDPQAPATADGRPLFEVIGSGEYNAETDELALNAPRTAATDEIETHTASGHGYNRGAA